MNQEKSGEFDNLYSFRLKILVDILMNKGQTTTADF